MASWEEFLQDKLLSTGLIDGFVLLSKFASKISTYGTLQNTQQAVWSPVFKYYQYNDIIVDDNEQPPSLSLELTFTNKQQSMRFISYKRTNCSIYFASATTSQDYLVACNLPYGMLICHYSMPGSSAHVISVIEGFCKMLRS